VFIEPTRSPNRAITSYYRSFGFFVEEPMPLIIRQTLWRVVNTGRVVIGRFRRRSQGAIRSNIWEEPSSITHQKVSTRRGLPDGGARPILERLGLDDSRPYVLLAVRDHAYYTHLRATNTVSRLGKEVLDNTMIRNPDIRTYAETARRLQEYGISMIRVGHPVSPLPVELADVVVDYSSCGRTEEGDVILARHCSLLINGTSGFHSLVSAFNRPVAHTNLYNFFKGSGLSQRDLFIPQLVWDHRESRYLAFGEMSMGRSRFSRHDASESQRWTLIKNRPEQIRAVVEEALNELRGSDELTEADVTLRRRFDALRQPPAGSKWCHGRIGINFLKDHEELLR
jgi:putative glycosyltransferase (TIGR04372 family)